MKLAEIPQLKSASPTQKIALIDELWASISPADLPAPASHLAELDRRLAELKKDPGKALTPAEARAKIRQKSKL